MEFREVLRRRKMVRTFDATAIEPDVVERILEAGNRGPSAGFTQGYGFLVLEGPEETRSFWDVVSAEARDWATEGTRRAPLVVIPFSSKQAYLERYAEPDKGWTDRDEARWPAPFWDIDTAFASMLMLLAAVDEGLGGLFFGLFPPTIQPFKEAYGVPREFHPIGAMAFGYWTEDPVPSSRDRRPRKSLDEVIHRGRW